MTSTTYESWGRLTAPSREVVPLRHRVADLGVLPHEASWLPYGNGRSYGDSCLNADGLLIDTRALDRFIAFDRDTGRLTCEAGVLLSDVLQLAVPHGWFLCVTPGTQFVTVGGAIANDVHGKNHHVKGAFGRHVLRFEILRSDGSRVTCSADENAGLYQATIGGLGLTGLVQWAELQLRPVASPLMLAETIKFGALDEFFELAAQSDRAFEFTVAWVDCLAQGGRLGRGLFTRAMHAERGQGALRDVKPPRSFRFPIETPFSLVGRMTLSAFNAVYYRHFLGTRKRGLVHFRPFFFPLDRVTAWNRVYGRRGLFQFQCVVPKSEAPQAIAEMLRNIAKAGQGSFLAVLKMFGDVTSPGMLSFPRPGATLTLDFPNSGERTLRLLRSLEDITLSAGGALYPAKDACMTPAAFRRSYPRLDEFRAFVDPQFSSSFWRRVGA
jgi:FAD/FMN-containing dehydrogenase